MKPEQFSAKNVIKQAIADCRATWPLTLQELREVLISCAGDLAAEERHPTRRAADPPSCRSWASVLTVGDRVGGGPRDAL